MSDSLTIALAQLNPVVGDIEGNLEQLRRARDEAAGAGAELVVGTELGICGYPPEDLVLKPAFLAAVREAVETLAAETADGGPAILVGAPWLDDPHMASPLRRRVYNAALLLDEGQVAAVRHKVELPNYGVFDEVRVFRAGSMPGPVNFRGRRLGVMICEDMWAPDVAECLGESGAEILLVINGSPFEAGKHDLRVQLAVQRVTETGLPLIYVNQVGGQDELVFDGASFVLDPDCALRAQLPFFETGVAMTRWTLRESGWQCAHDGLTPPLDGLEVIYRGLVTGLSDYVRKNGFPGVVLGLSGGIDSALSAVLAVDALGPEKVRCLMLPSPFTSRESLEDAAECARLLGVRLDEVRIDPAMQAFEAMMRPLFDDLPADTTEENIQARARGIALMAVSNKFGPMVLSTGNKSEMSVGYSTLYGDMCGGFNALKDIYKTTVYALARWRNQTRPAGVSGPDGRVIPERIITRAPTAELRANQTDQDSLPPYEELDEVLACLIEEEMSVEEIVARGHARETVKRIWRMLENAEYKRRQAPPGVKITRRSFGRDRRYPITNRFKGSA